MKILVLLTCLLIPFASYGGILGAAKYGFRFERDSESSNLVSRNPYGLLLGYRQVDYAYTFEYLTFSQTSGNSTLSIDRKQNLFLAGVRYHPFDSEDVFTWYPYFAGFLGGYYERISTRLIGQVDERTSKWLPVFGVGAGVFGRIIDSFRMGPEVRVLLARDFDPQAVLDLGLTMGLEF